MTSVFIPRIDSQPLDELTSLLTEVFPTDHIPSFDLPSNVYEFVLANLTTIASHEYIHDVLSLTFHSIVLDEDNLLTYIPKYITTVSAEDSIPLVLRLELIGFAYNLLNVASGFRYDAFKALLQLYAQSPQPYHLFATLGTLETLLSHWALPVVDTAILYFQVYEVAKKFSSVFSARKYLGQALALFAQADQQDSDMATKCAITAVVDAFSLTTPEVTLCHHIGYDVLLENPIVQHLRTIPQYSPVISLLEIFSQGTLSQLEELLEDSESFSAILSTLPNASRESLFEQVAALSLSDHVKPGQQYTYTQIAGFLQLPDNSQVEDLLVDSFTVGQISGKISQHDETVAIHRVTPRRYTPELWNTLRAQINKWRPGVSRMLSPSSNDF